MMGGADGRAIGNSNIGTLVDGRANGTAIQTGNRINQDDVGPSQRLGHRDNHQYPEPEIGSLEHSNI